MERYHDHAPSLGPKAKIVSGLAVALVVLAMLAEMTLLRGKTVADVRVGLGVDETATFAVHEVGKAHLVEVRATRSRRGKAEGRRLKLRLEDPDGEVVYESDEWASRKERFFSFTPKVDGTYTIFAEPELLSGSSTGHARVKVLVGDRRVLARLFAAMPF